MAENALQVEIRQDRGKGVARRIRAAGRIPGICYGKGFASTPISLDPDALRQLLEKSEAGMNTLINLQVAGGGEFDGALALVRELQRDPVRGYYLHADLYRVDLQEKVEVSVPIHIQGKARGVEMGGILDHSLRELELECLPLAIPSEIVADVTELDIGDSLHVRDLQLPEGVELVSDPDLSVVSVVTPTKEEEPAAAAEVPAEGEAAVEEGKEPEAPGAAEEREGKEAE